MNRRYRFFPNASTKLVLMEQCVKKFTWAHKTL